MKVAIGADHKGVHMKDKVGNILRELGHEVTDYGTHSKQSADYPDFGLKVAHAVASGNADRGITVCWTGNGMAIAANKVKGIRAGLALNSEMAHLTRLHNDANVLSLAAKYTPESVLKETVREFMETEFEGGRHCARLNKIKAEEEGSAVSID